jgi:hypothetical protein
VSVYKEARPRVCSICLSNEQSPTKVRSYLFNISGDLSKDVISAEIPAAYLVRRVS